MNRVQRAINQWYDASIQGTLRAVNTLPPEMRGGRIEDCAYTLVRSLGNLKEGAYHLILDHINARVKRPEIIYSPRIDDKFQNAQDISQWHKQTIDGIVTIGKEAIQKNTRITEFNAYFGNELSIFVPAFNGLVLPVYQVVHAIKPDEESLAKILEKIMGI